MGRIRAAAGLAGVAAIVAVLAAPTAQARNVEVRMKLKDADGYGVTIDAGRGSATVITTVTESRLRRAADSRMSKRLVGAGDRTGLEKLAQAARHHRRGFVSLGVQGKRAASFYGSRGTVTGKRLWANLGDFGRIRLHFHSHRKTSVKAGPHCNHRIPERIGTFTGRVRFHGENDYVKVRANQAEGRVLFPPHRIYCHRHFHHHGHHRRADLYRQVYAEGSNAYFAAVSKQRAGKTAFYAGSFERSGRVFVDRFRDSRGQPEDFTINEGGTAAHVDPSTKVIRGSADFAAPHDWTGSLRTSFPGAHGVSMAGPDFKAWFDEFRF